MWSHMSSVGCRTGRAHEHVFAVAAARVRPDRGRARRRSPRSWPADLRPGRLGKREVALALADHVLAQGDATHATRTRQLIAAGTHPDLQLVSFIPNKSGDKLRTEIVIEQVREITDKLALTPQYGVAQVVIVDPADAINRSAANALLKTLEEPQPGRYLWLISSDPARLPQTIRSRCQRLEFKLPPQHEALAWLQQLGHSEASAREALRPPAAIPARPTTGCAKTA